MHIDKVNLMEQNIPATDSHDVLYKFPTENKMKLKATFASTKTQSMKTHI